MVRSSLVVVEVTKSLSKIVKSNFVAFSEQKRYIQSVDQEDPNVVKSTLPKNDSGERSDIEIKQQRQVDELKEQIKDLEQQLNSMNDHLSHEGYQAGLLKGEQEGYDAGYQNGMTQAEQEINEMKSTLQKEFDSKLEAAQMELNSDYAIQLQELEPKVLHLVKQLVDKLVGVASLNQDTIMHLIRSGLEEVEIHGDITIKVSPEDLEEVVDHKASITDTLSDKFQVEILKDPKLERNECVIETNMGTIDCSLGVQMQGLMKELELIEKSLGR